MTTMAQASKFWDNIADRYSKQPIADEDVYKTKLRVARGYLQPDMEILEFGCGTGGTAIAHAAFAKHIQAIDFSERMLEIARTKADAEDIANVTFEKADITSLSVPDETYDAVLGLSILHLLKNKDEVIAKVFRMLKPGGVFVTSTTCLGDTMFKVIAPIFKVISPIGKALGALPHLDVMTSKDLVRSLTAAGFKIDHHWQPGKGKDVFIVAKKAG